MDLISIKEAANKLSVPSSVIDHYIDKGLIAHSGNRDLSNYEFEELCKIVLLQSLGISISDIAELQSGAVALSDVLKKRIDVIMSDPSDITQAGIVCQNIRLEGCDYRTLDPMPHLEQISELKSRGGVFPEITIPGNTGLSGSINIGNANDKIPLTATEPISFDRTSFPGTKAFLVTPEGIIPLKNAAEASPQSVYPHPFLRVLARGIDMSIYMLIVLAFIRLVFRFDPIASMSASLLSGITDTSDLRWVYAVYALMFVLEPLVIHFAGTTPGKLIFGIRILDASGEKLSFKAAYLRSFRLLRYGYGFMIPFYNVYRYIRSFIECQVGNIMPWDVGLEYRHPEKFKTLSIGLFIPAALLISFLISFTGMLFEMPGNKAPLTEEAFYDNISSIARYNSLSTLNFPEYVLTVESGKVTGVSFTISESDIDTIYANYYPMYVAFMAFAGAQPEASVYSINYVSPAKAAFSDSMKDFSFEYAGVYVTNTVSYTGYNRNIISDYLYKNAENSVHEFTQTFSMTLGK
ncbi:MAG: RDD family protein [Lachnospiraceae bacterium]|nr:RDD family protein [Lachnospiraceae bacterium]